MIKRALAVILLLGAETASAGAYKFVTLEFPPLEFTNDRGAPDGAAVEIVSAVMKRLGHSLTIEVMPWSRCMNLVKSGKADAVFTAYRNQERAGFLDFAKENLVAQVVGLFVKKGSGRTFTGDFKVLKPFTFGVLNTISYGETFDNAKTKLGLKTERVEDVMLNFKKLAAGRVDYVVSNRYSAEVAIETLRLRQQVTELPRPVEVTPSFVAFSKKRQLGVIRDAFDKELRLFKQSGQYQVILDKFRVRAPASE